MYTILASHIDFSCQGLCLGMNYPYQFTKDGPDSHNFKWNLILPGKFFICQAFESIFVRIPTKFHTSELPISVMETVMSTEHIMY